MWCLHCSRIKPIILSHMLEMKQNCGLTETNKIGVQKQQLWSLHFFWGCLHTFTAKASVILDFISPKHSLVPPTQGGILSAAIRSSLGVVGSGLSEQWVQSAQSQCALLGVGASTGSCGCEGCRKDRNWRCVFCVLSSRRILQLFWPGKMCGERTFSCGSLGALFH